MGCGKGINGIAATIADAISQPSSPRVSGGVPGAGRATTASSAAAAISDAPAHT